jgi:RNA-directed DNA polymerase
MVRRSKRSRKDLEGNLYKIWKRMALGSYFQPPVCAVCIPKKSGDGESILGVPAVGYGIVQMVVKQLIEPELEVIFLPDSEAPASPNYEDASAVLIMRARSELR